MPISPGTNAIQPIVLVGGRSRRFGRDKLREPLDGGWLVDRPIAALRAVFGPMVAAVGECDPMVSARADLVIADRYPGLGPAGGILSALEGARRDVFVLAGDLPLISSGAVEAIFSHAARVPNAWAVLAATDRLEPCIGLYRVPCAEPIRRRLNDPRGPSLFDLVPPEHLSTVQIPTKLAANINTPSQLEHNNDGG